MAQHESKLRETILSLSENNKRRWSHFTGDAPLTQPRFKQRMLELGITRNPTEADELWSLFEVNSREMQFRDFVRFIQQQESNVPRPKFETNTASSLLMQIRGKRVMFLQFCIESDPQCDGYITQRAFTDFALSTGVISQPNALFPLLQQFDSDNSGNINYFEVLYNISTLSEEQAPPSRQSSGPRSGLDPMLFGERNQPEQSYHQTNARGSLDPSIFGEKPQSDPAPERGGRGDLDPAIFGERPAPVQMVEQPVEQLDLSKTRDCTTFSSDQTITLISKIANAKFRSVRDCFGNWRGSRDRLDASDLFRGLARDGNVEVSTDVLDRLLSNYGGELTMAGFTRFVSDGARINAAEPVIEAPPPLTERDILLNKISDGLKGKQWEVVLRTSSNALELSRNLKKLGVNIKSADLREMYEEIGMKGVIAEVKDRQKPKKRRG